MYLHGSITVPITGDLDDWEPAGGDNADWWFVEPDAVWNLSGIAAKYRGRLIVLTVKSNSLVLLNLSGGSAVGNQFEMTANLTVPEGSTVILAYDILATAWRPLARPFVVADDSITFAMLQNIATDTLVGRDTAGTGDPESITVGGGIEFTGAGAIRTTAFTGDVTKTAGGTALTIANDAVTYAKMQNVSAASRLLGRGSAAGAGDVEEVTLGTNLSMSGTTLNATGGGLTYSTQGANFSAAVNNAYIITANSVTATLPSTGTRGDKIAFYLRSGITSFIVGRNTRSIQGVAEDMTVDMAPTSFTLVFDDTTNGWWLA